MKLRRKSLPELGQVMKLGQSIRLHGVEYIVRSLSADSDSLTIAFTPADRREQFLFTDSWLRPPPHVDVEF